MEENDRYLSININDLHNECAKQPELYHDHAVMLARAEKVLDQAKTDLKLVEAKLDGEIRDAPEAFGLKKITDESVKMAIIRDPRYQKATKKVSSLKFQVAVHEADVKALDQRKPMIEKLVQLRLASYFADPVLPQADSEEVDRRRKEDIRSRGYK